MRYFGIHSIPVQKAIFLRLGIFIVLFGLVGCGGGGSASAPIVSSGPTPTPVPTGDFSLQTEASQVSIQQQGVSQFLVVFLNRLQGFNGQVTISLQGLPAGVTAVPTGPTTFVGSANASAVFQLSASTSAAVTTTSITVAGTSGTLNHSVTCSLAVLPIAPFNLVLSTTNVNLTPGAQAPIHVALNAAPGVSPGILLTISSVPANGGVTVSIPPFGLSPTNPLDVTLNAQMIAQPIQNFPLTFIATDNSVNPPQTNISTITLNLTIPFPAIATRTRSTFARTEEDATSAVYDPLRRLVFTTVNTLNQVRVFSSADASLRATIPVPFPQGIDISADGSQIFVGSNLASRISVIDPDLLEVVKVVPGPVVVADGPAAAGLDYPVTIRALSNGKVLLIAQHSDTTENHVFLWDPVAGTMTQKDPAGILTLQDIVRSPDHSRALAYGNGFTLGGTAVSFYDLIGDTFEPILTAPATKFVMNPNGSQLAAWSTNDITDLLFFDGQLNQLASVPALSGTGFMEPIYSLDGNLLYVLTNYFGVAHTVDIFNAHTFTPVGVVPDISIGNSFFEKAYAVDETGMIFRGDQPGLAFVDASSPGAFSVPTFGLGSQSFVPQALSVSAPSSTVLSGIFPASEHRIFFGAAPASPATLEGTITGTDTAFTHVTSPAGPAGPANATLVRTDGWYAIAPDAVSYGPHNLFSLVAGPASGGANTTIYGYGFGFPTQISIGGLLASNIQTTGSTGSFPLPINTAKFNAPAGAPGLADVTVTTPQGSLTIPGAYQYLKQAQIFPIPGVLNQIIYDQPRQKLYITNTSGNRVEVFSLATQSLLSPIPVGTSPTGIAQTPDGTMLAVTNEGDGTVSVIDPDQANVTSTFSVIVPSDLDPNFCRGRAISLTPVGPHKMLVEVNCTALLANGHIRLLDLTTGSFSCTGVVNCNTNGIDIDFSSGLAAFASSKDGTKVMLGAIGVTPGTLELWDVNANQTLVRTRAGFLGQVGINADANLFSIDAGEIFDAQLNLVELPQDVTYLEALGRSDNNNFGAKLNPSGSLLFYPQTNSSVDIFDVHQGRLALRMSLPEPSPETLDPMVLDETGNRMFLISNSGITIAELSQSPLSIARLVPSSATAGTAITVRGSGFQSGTTVTFGTSTVPATFIDTNTLQMTVPSLVPGAVRIAVKNPDGRQYSFDAAFTVN